MVLALAGSARAQEPLNFPAPLAPAPAAVSRAQDELTRSAAERARELGFSSVAAGLYRELLDHPGGDRAGLALGLATALLEDGLAADAQKALEQSPGPRGAAWHLRAGLAAAQLRKTDAARAELGAVKPGELTAADRPWRLFLEGGVAGAAGDLARAGDFFQQARRAAQTDLERARFFLAEEEARMRSGQPSAAAAEQMRQNAERFQGTETGYDFARAYAVMLDALGRREAAVEALQRDLFTLHPQERVRADDFRLLLGMIAGAGDGAGRSALVQLLENGGDPDRQRVALELLGRALSRGAGRDFFRTELDKLVARPSPHPILDDLLLARAELALGDKPPEYAAAEGSAHALLDHFPGSPLKAHALGVLTRAAWEEGRFRTAADFARQARQALPPGDAKARLGVVMAESWFRAGDFRSAADAYEAALRERPPGVPAGDMMFQRIEAEILAGDLKGAEASLDGDARNPDFDAVNRWEAEWNLAKALRVEGQTQAAYARVNRLLAGNGPPLPPELRVRMAWLQARLSLDAGEPARTLELADAMGRLLHGMPRGLATEIDGMGALLKAEACFDLRQEAEALDILKTLRADYPRGEAAISSYFVEAEHYARQDQVVEAQQLLTRLADDFPKSVYAAYALYQAAWLSERLGQDKNLVEANRLIERLVTTYPDSSLVFDARLKQGELLRRLNQFPQAQQVYESLINNYAGNPDVILARLALAECHNAQSASDPSHEETALLLFDDLSARVDAPADVRVEAGYNLGHIYLRRGQSEKAVQTWWRDVVTPFLLNSGNAAKLEEKGRYWMARTLLDLGGTLQKQGRLDEAGRAWRYVLSAGLPGAALARANLSNLNPQPPKQ
jgi:tetratricopeptide (TPR) repeat protein